MSDDKLEQAAFKIFRMTHEGVLVWTPKAPPHSWCQATDAVYPAYFETEYQGRKLALFEMRAPASSREKIAARIEGEQADPWSESVHLALLGGNDEILFEFPRSRQIRDLMVTVRYKASNVEEFLDDLLKSDSVEVKQ